MAIDAAEQDPRAVDQEVEADDLDPSEPDREARLLHELATRRREPDGEPIERGFLG